MMDMEGMNSNQTEAIHKSQWDRIAALEAEVARQRTALEVLAQKAQVAEGVWFLNCICLADPPNLDVALYTAQQVGREMLCIIHDIGVTGYEAVKECEWYKPTQFATKLLEVGGA
jgi:hypothetical protein